MKRLFLAALLFSSVARAEFLDGNKLYDDLTSSSQAARDAGTFYVMGVHDALRGITICDPANVTGQQVSDMTLVALRDHPEVRQYSADVIVARILVSAWPCKKPAATGPAS